MSARNGPPEDSRGGAADHGPRPTAENPGEKFTADDTRRPRRPSGSHSEREAALRRALDRATDPGTIRLLRAFLDDEYVSRAHLRADDREIRRLRRWLREAA